MQIGTSLFYNRTTAAMNALSDRAAALGVQVSTGKKLQTASDDSVAYQRLQGLTKATTNDTAYGQNLTIASSVLAQADTTLSSVTAQLQRASELAIKAANGTYSDADKQAMGEELSGIVDSLKGLANTKDVRGQAIFGGSDGGDGVTTDASGNVTLASAAVSAIPIGDGQSVQANETATRVFAFTGTSGATDIFATLTKLATALKAGGDTSAATSAAIDDIQTASTQVNSVQASLGARASRVELQQAQLTDSGTERAGVISTLEGSTPDDLTAAITELQKTSTILSATQASFTKLSSLSLFDYLK